MASKITKRKSIHSTNAKLNFRPSPTDNIKSDIKGTKPTSTPTSVKEIATLMILHLCRKSLFFNTNLKVALYLGALFIVSLVADVYTVPKGYFARPSNLFNKYFVKFAWGWNLILLTPYLVLTSYVYCCGQKDKIVKNHFVRLLVATFFWWFWTSLFQFIEHKYGKCNIKSEQFNTKQTCLKNGYIWNGFDISGHSFILIYGSLLFIEETRSMTNWDSIKDYIRLEDHYRTTKDGTISNNSLRSLNDQQFKFLQVNYEKYTPYIRGLFVAITVFQILWDVMLISTMLYFHVMIEKFLGGAIAILTWYFTYRFWYDRSNVLPSLPGDGLFKYMKSKTTSNNISSSGRKRTASIVGERSNSAHFMGMPLYGLKMDNGNLANSQVDDNMFR